MLNYCVTLCLRLAPQCKSYHINIASIFTLLPHNAASICLVATRDATIHILSVSIYHLLCITIQRCIARYSMTDFCRWTEPFFQNHHVSYLPNSYRTVKLAYNLSISHKTVHIICSVEVKTWIYQARYSTYPDTRYINTT